jgi:hypothetical protein
MDFQVFSATLASVLERVMAWLCDHPEEPVSAVADSLDFRAELVARVRQLDALLDAADGKALFLAEDLARDLSAALGAAGLEGFELVLAAVRRVDFDGADREMKAALPRLEAALA